MTIEGVGALSLLRSRALQVAETVARTNAWEEPSACAGWTVRDVFAHLAQMFRSVVDPDPALPSTGTAERDAEAGVEALRGEFADRIMELYRDASARGLGTLERIQHHGPDRELVMAELGSYPRHLLADAFVFDHYTHLEVDLVCHVPALTDERARGVEVARPVLTWMLAGLDQMCAGVAPALTDPIELDLSGPAGGRWLISGRSGGVAVTERLASAHTTDAAAAVISSSDRDFVEWATTRRPWAEVVRVSGDQQLAERVLNAINII